MDVFLLWHVHEVPDGEEDAKLIGVYSSRESAERAQRRVAVQPGFRDAPAGFHIDRYVVDADHWAEGYVTETHEEIMRACRGPGPTWAVHRQDDNGNRFEVRAGLGREEAERLVAEFEARGHKQVYWAVPEQPDGPP